MANALKIVKSKLKSLIGKYMLSTFEKRKPTDVAAVFAGPYMGDALYVMAFVEEYKKLHQDLSIHILTPSPAIEKIVKTYEGYDRVVPLTKFQSKMLCIAFGDLKTAKSAEEKGLFKTPVNGGYSIEYVNIMDRLRKVVFKLEDETPIHYHRLASKRVSSIQNFYKKCDRIIIINPYSNSCHITRSVMEALERLARYMENYGGGGILSIQM